jgi:hypothetical protein
MSRSFIQRTDGKHGPRCDGLCTGEIRSLKNVETGLDHETISSTAFKFPAKHALPVYLMLCGFVSVQFYIDMQRLSQQSRTEFTSMALAM